MSKRHRTEKPTLLLDPAVVAHGPRAALLAEQINALGGKLEMSESEITYTVPEESLTIAAQAVAEFCSCGKPGEVLVPAGPELESAELECWDCVDHHTVPE